MQAGISVLRLNFPFLTSSNLPECRQFFDTVLPVRATRLVIDLGPLQFFDSNGLAGLLRTIARVMTFCEVRLCSSSPNVHALFQLMRGNSVLKCYWNCEEALTSFANPQDLVLGVESHDRQQDHSSPTGIGLVATSGN
jgi:anti-anti-sigma factor